MEQTEKCERKQTPFPVIVNKNCHVGPIDQHSVRAFRYWKSVRNIRASTFGHLILWPEKFCCWIINIGGDRFVVLIPSYWYAWCRNFFKLLLQSPDATTSMLIYFDSHTGFIAVGLYGSETWTMRKVDSDRIQSFHMQALRRILSIRWYDKVSNAVVNERTKLPDVPSLIADRRNSLFGHICRLPENTLRRHCNCQ